MATALNSKMENALQDLISQYEKLVRSNPDTVAKIESATRIVSFLVAGRFQNGPVISELIYSASNLLVFLHDNIYKNSVKCLPKLKVSTERVQRLLTVIEYTEVFLEMAAHKRWGQPKAWIVITVIQLMKTVLRFVLLIKMNSGIQMNPIVPPADRELLKASVHLEHDALEEAWDEENTRTVEMETFTLSSGRHIRTLKSAKDAGLRTWNVPSADCPETLVSEASRKRKQLLQQASKLDPKRMWGECLHIARPLAHLFSMYICGQNSWKPWLLASGMDVSSLYLMGETKELSPREQSEIRRRNILLLYFLMRSPFYDKFTKARLVSVLTFIANYVPLSRLFVNPLLEYLPTWQKLYFYVWTS